MERADEVDGGGTQLGDPAVAGGAPVDEQGPARERGQLGVGQGAGIGGVGPGEPQPGGDGGGQVVAGLQAHARGAAWR
ncbi:MAG: hypothetical protein QJR03_03695 [Sphaerobacter sp.]|nr:hypothetical protein [Sphaerobacter sp.]